MKRSAERLTLAASAFAFAGAGYYAGSPYYSAGVRGAQAAYVGSYAIPDAVTAYYAGGPWYGYSGWDDYATRNGLKCTPGTTIKLDDGLMHVCQ